MFLTPPPSGSRRLVGVALLCSTIAATGCSGGGGSSSPAPAPVTTATSTPATPTPATPAPSVAFVSHPAGASDTFVESVGLNTHYGSQYYPASSYAAIDSLVTTLGVRHLRDAAYATGEHPDVCAHEATLPAQNVHVDAILSDHMTADDIRAWIACTGTALDAFESYNEYDLSHAPSDTNWPQTLGAVQQTLYTTVKQDALATNVAVLGPSVTSPAAAQAVGSLAGLMDYGNIHAYLAGFDPETTGYGANGYGSLAYNQALGANVSGSRTQFITETSQSTLNVPNSVDAATQRKYYARTLLYSYANGIARTYLYELVDEPTVTPVAFAYAGLVDQNLAPKPSFDELRGIIATLADPGPAFTPQAATFGMTGSTANVDYVLSQKRSGVYELAIWLGVQSYDPNANKPIAIAPQAVTIAFPTAVTTANLYGFDASGTIQKQSLVPGSSLQVNVTDDVQILEFK